MKTAYWLPLLAVAAFAADCETDTFDSDTDLDTTGFSGDFLISTLNLTCDDGGTAATKADDTVTLDVMFDGWAETVEMDIINTADGNFPSNLPAVYDEYHVLPADANIEFASDGSSDTWQYIMDTQDSLVSSELDDRASGATFFDCSADDGNRLETTSVNGSSPVFTSVAVKVEGTVDATSGAIGTTDCLVFGEKASTAYSGDGCLCSEEFLATPPASPCGDH